MTPYKITDRCLPYLAIANLLMIGPLLWLMWMPLSFGIYPHEGNATTWIFNILVYGIGIELTLILLSAWSFFKKWRYMLLLYIPVSLYMLPDLIEQTILYYHNSSFDTSFYLPGKVHTYAYETLLVATLIVCIIFIAEHAIARHKGSQHHT